MHYEKPSREKLHELYVERKLSGLKIAESLGHSSHTIYGLLREYHIPRRELGEAIKLGKNSGRKPSKEKLGKMYVKDGMSMREIGKSLGVSYQSVSNWLHECNIPVRERGDAIALHWSRQEANHLPEE